MKEFRKRFSRLHSLLSGFAIATLTTGYLITPGFHTPVEASLEDSPKTVIDEVWQIVNNEFVDRDFNHTDWQAVRQELLTQEYSSSEEAYRAIRQSLRRLGDPYTRFLAPKEFEDLTNQTTGELSGIGIRLGMHEETGKLVIVEPIPNSPASAADVKAGDKVVAIDGKLTSLMTLEQASEAIRGELGTEVTLELERDEKGKFNVVLTRAQIELPSVHAMLRQEGSMQVGYIRLDEFSSHAAEQMKKAILDLDNQKVDGFVLDLRGNPGGLLYASVDIARMWMEQGQIVRTIDRKGGDRQFSANHTAITDLPLVVLVDQNSASASEILAGALKDNRRATIVGTRTYGKGTVQSVHSLTDGSGIAVTISRYYPPSGINITKQGITPDIELNLTGEQKLILESNPNLVGTVNDPLYSRALSVLGTQGISQSSRSREPISIR